MADDWGWVPWVLLAFAVGLFLGRAPPQQLNQPRLQIIEPVPTVTYHNDETWEIVTDRRGRVTGVRGKRRAEQTKG